MALLVIDGLQVPVALDDGVSTSTEEIGDRGRAVDGSLLDSVRAVKMTWSIVTPPIPTATRDAILEKLNAANPLVAITGELAGARDVRPVVRGNTPVTLAAGRHWILQFDLLEN